ncbi:hypothetical protein FQN60_013980, partial [Etheostoma spectabile]
GAQRSWSEIGEKRSVHKVTITALSVIGGIDVKDSVWRVMKHCFTKPLANSSTGVASMAKQLSTKQ